MISEYYVELKKSNVVLNGRAEVALVVDDLGHGLSKTSRLWELSVVGADEDTVASGSGTINRI